jgi:hypothetical protein
MKNTVSVNQPYFDVLFITAKDGLKSFRDNVLTIDVKSSVNEMINQWQVTLVPRDSTKSFNTLYEIIEPMSYCEIRVRNFLQEPRVIMRGFVSNVSKSVEMGSGIPQRQIVITGENYGKLLRMSYIHYAYGLDPLTTVGASGTGAPLFFGYGVDLSTTVEDPNPANVMTQIFSNLVKPNFNNIQSYLSDRTKVTDQLSPTSNDFVGKRQTPGDIAASKIPGFTMDVDEDGVNGTRTLGLNLQFIDPAAGAQEQSVLEFMQNCAGFPWNELYTDDAPEKTYLVFRPRPWRDRSGGFVGATSFGAAKRGNLPKDRQDEAEPKAIQPEDIVSYQLSRTDEEVYNYFLTDSIGSIYGNNFEGVVRSLPDNENPHYTAGILKFVDQSGNEAVKSSEKLEFSRIELFGFRKFRVATRFLAIPPGSNWKKEFGDAVDNPIDQAKVLNMLLFNAFEHSSQLESGILTIKGREDIRAGMYVKMLTDRSDLDSSLYYVSAAQHTIVAFQNYVTILTLTRGEAHLNHTMDNKENII